MKAALGVGLISSLVAALLGGWVAVRSVDWYQISSREGASGYFIVFVALGSAIAGLVLGIIASRLVVAQWQGGFGAQLGGALGLVVLCTAAAGAAARSLAHVPPTMNGEPLHLAVELSWPEGSAPDFSRDTAPPYLALGARLGSQIAESVNGPLFTDLTREEDGRVIVPGVVPLVTTRGARLLMLEFGDPQTRTGFEVPLPANPGDAERAWSEWLPRAAAGAAPLPDGVRYRVRVLARSEPVRTDTVGGFTIDMIAEFHNGTAGSAVQTRARYAITHAGATVVIPEAGADTTSAVLVVNAPSAALVVQTGVNTGNVRCWLVVSDAGTVRTQALGRCGNPVRAALLMNATDSTPSDTRASANTVNRTTLAVPGRYLMDASLLDTRTLTATAIGDETSHLFSTWYAPVSVSPDGDRFVRVVATSDRVQLMEVSLPSFDLRALPLAHAVLPTGDWDDANAAWFSHHYEWRAEGASAFRAEPRTNIAPLAHRGVLKREPTGHSYDVRGVQRALRAELVPFLVEALGAELVTEDGNPADDRATPRSDDGVPFSRRIRLRGTEVQVSWIPDGQRVSVWVYPTADQSVIATIAERVDAQLATHAWDGFFLPLGTP